MTKRLSILAGAGGLVPELAVAALADGWDVQIIDFDGSHEIENVAHVVGKLSNPLGVLGAMRKFGASHFCLVGRVVVTPKNRGKLLSMFGGSRKPGSGRGDAVVSKLAGALYAMTGAQMIGIHEIIPQLLAPEGHFAGPKPSSLVQTVAQYGFEKARELGRLDIGQALVCSEGHILAVEDLAGTDALLARIADYREQGLLDGVGKSLVLAKSGKPQQTDSIDMPAIGPDTVLAAKRAGVDTIVVEAGRTLMVERGALFEAAARENICLLGLVPADE